MLLAYVGNSRCFAALLKIPTHGQIRVLKRDDVLFGRQSTWILKQFIMKEMETFAIHSHCELLDFFDSCGILFPWSIKRFSITVISLPTWPWLCLQIFGQIANWQFNLFMHIVKRYLCFSYNNSLLRRGKWEGIKLKININDSFKHNLVCLIQNSWNLLDKAVILMKVIVKEQFVFLIWWGIFIDFISFLI